MPAAGVNLTVIVPDAFVDTAPIVGARGGDVATKPEVAADVAAR